MSIQNAHTVIVVIYDCMIGSWLACGFPSFFCRLPARCLFTPRPHRRPGLGWLKPSDQHASNEVDATAGGVAAGCFLSFRKYRAVYACFSTNGSCMFPSVCATACAGHFYDVLDRMWLVCPLFSFLLFPSLCCSGGRTAYTP